MPIPTQIFRAIAGHESLSSSRSRLTSARSKTRFGLPKCFRTRSRLAGADRLGPPVVLDLGVEVDTLIWAHFDLLILADLDRPGWQDSGMDRRSKVEL